MHLEVGKLYQVILYPTKVSTLLTPTTAVINTFLSFVFSEHMGLQSGQVRRTVLGSMDRRGPDSKHLTSDRPNISLPFRLRFMGLRLSSSEVVGHYLLN